MAVVTIRNCLICQTPMQCTRASKLLCSNICHSRMHKHRVKLGLTNAEYINILKTQQKEVEENATSD